MNVADVTSGEGAFDRMVPRELPLRTDFSAGELRQLAKRAEEVRGNGILNRESDSTKLGITRPVAVKARHVRASQLKAEKPPQGGFSFMPAKPVGRPWVLLRSGVRVSV
jgi:hypothetical protein